MVLSGKGALSLSLLSNDSEFWLAIITISLIFLMLMFGACGDFEMCLWLLIPPDFTFNQHQMVFTKTTWAEQVTREDSVVLLTIGMECSLGQLLIGVGLVALATVMKDLCLSIFPVV